MAVSKRLGFSMVEAVIGIGLAAVLILSIIALSTAALSGDSKAEMTQVALSAADAELNRFARAVSVVGSSARSEFWSAPDSVSEYQKYSGAGALSESTSNRTAFTYEYRYVSVGAAGGTALLGKEQPDNRLRKVDLTVGWWNGEEGKPGYGRLTLTATRLIRESDLREP
ncbi:MAG: hypothetical protein WC314_07440 [Vulcanimicrobiota bacterium]